MSQGNPFLLFPWAPPAGSSPSYTNLTVTGQGLFGNGSEAAPSVAFINDPDTGMYRTGGNTIGFSAGGVNSLNIDNAQVYPNASTPGTYNIGATGAFRFGSLFAVTGDFTGAVKAWDATAIPAGGTAGSGFLFSSTANFGVFFGSGAPTLSAAKGSLYLRSDGSGTGDRAYINTNGTTGWTALTTAA